MKDGSPVTHFNALGMHLGNLSRLSAAETRSISPENPTGEPGRGGMATTGTGADAARELGQGWKVSPSIDIAGHETATLGVWHAGQAVDLVMDLPLAERTVAPEGNRSRAVPAERHDHRPERLTTIDRPRGSP